MDINLTEKFEQVLDEFDFIKIYNIMKFLEWKWHDADENPGVNEMIRNCKRLFQNCLDMYIRDGERGFSGSGGFEIEINNNHIDLRFVIESAEYDPEWE